MINRTERVPVTTIAPSMAAANRTAMTRAPRRHSAATTTGVPRARRSAIQVGMSASPATPDGRIGSDVIGKPRASQRRHSGRTAMTNDHHATATTIAMTTMSARRPTGWLAWRASSQKIPAYAMLCQAAGQLRLG